MIVEASVTTNQKRFALAYKDGRLKISLENAPENNKANIELITTLSKLLGGKQVRIIKGQTSRRKTLAIDIEKNDWDAFLKTL